MYLLNQALNYFSHLMRPDLIVHRDYFFAQKLGISFNSHLKCFWRFDDYYVDSQASCSYSRFFLNSSIKDRHCVSLIRASLHDRKT